jgi:hypothetical protein
MWRVIVIFNHGFMPTGLCVTIGGTYDFELYTGYVTTDDYLNHGFMPTGFTCDWIIRRHVTCG